MAGFEAGDEEADFMRVLERWSSRAAIRGRDEAFGVKETAVEGQAAVEEAAAVKEEAAVEEAAVEEETAVEEFASSLRAKDAGHHVTSTYFIM